MANREYEMLFRLGAQLGQNFNGTFSSAQQVLSATQKKIQELNRIQSNIDAYQRQQSGIEKSNQKLELYKNQLANTQRALDTVRREIEANGSASGELAARESELANKELALRNRIRDTENAIADKNARLRQMGQSLSDAGISTDNLSAEVQRLSNEMSELRGNEEQAALEAENFGGTATDSVEAVGAALVASGIAAGLKKIYDAYADCVGVSSEFEATMSTVEALSGANAKEMAVLSDEAKMYGATTVFTANQSAEAMTYMGMAGWKAQEMLSGMNGVMSLAAASGEDLGLVSDIVTDNLTAFGLKAKDTAHFSDVLAAAATNSNTSVAIMGETFSGSAAIAGALGYSIEDVATAVGLMANAGVKGSIAGTALKNMFNGLLEGATLSGKAIGDVEFTAINADGTMKGFAETINELRVYFDQMTEAERVNNAMTIAGQRGYNGLLAILNATDEDYQKLSKSINNCTGAAQRMADIKLDNLSGDVTLLQSAADGLKMSIGELYRDELRELSQMATQVLGTVQEFIQENPAVVKGIMAVAGGVGAVVAGYTAYAAISKISNALTAAGIGIKASENGLLMLLNVNLGKNAIAQMAAAGAQMKLNLAMLANPAAIVTASIIALTVGVIGYSEANKRARLETFELSTATQQQYDEVERLNSEYENACTQFGKTSKQALALKYDLDEANSAIESQTFSVSELYAEIDSLHNSTSDLLSSYREGTGRIREQQEQAQVLSAKLNQIATSSETAAQKEELMAPIIERLNSLYPSFGLTVENVTEKIDGLSDAINNAAGIESFQAKYEAAKESIVELTLQEEQLKLRIKEAEAAQMAASKAFTDTVNSEIVPDMSDFASKWYNYIGIVGLFNAAVGGTNAVISTFGGNAKKTKEDLDKVNDELRILYGDLNDVQQAISECEDVGVKYADIVNGTSEEVVSASTAMSIAISNVSEETQNLVAAYNDAYNAAYSSVSGQYALWDKAADVVPISVSTINSALSSQADYWDKYNANLEKLSKRAEKIEGLSDVIAGFADGSKESVNAIAGMANASDKDLKKMVANFESVKTEQDEIAKSLADVRTDFADNMDKIAQKMTETVEGMKLDKESAQAAKSTIQAYADAILAGKGKAVEAAEAVAQATAAALANALPAEPTNTSPKITVGNTIPAPTSTPTYPAGFVGPIPGSKPFDINSYIIGNKYASGTDYANAGFALVGEEGPEIVYMNGGEKVVDADDTKAILGGQSNTITISPQFVINNNGGEIDEGQVESLSERLIASVMDALEAAGIDRKRSMYA